MLTTGGANMLPTLATKDNNPRQVLRNVVGKSSLTNKYRVGIDMPIANFAV